MKLDLIKIYTELNSFENSFDKEKLYLNFELKKYVKNLHKFDKLEINIFEAFVNFYYTNYIYTDYINSKIFTKLKDLNIVGISEVNEIKNNTKKNNTNNFENQLRFLIIIYLIENEGQNFLKNYFLKVGFNINTFFESFLDKYNSDKVYFEQIKNINFCEIINNIIERLNSKILKAKEEISDDSKSIKQKYFSFSKILRYYSILHSFPFYITKELVNSLNNKIITVENSNEDDLKNTEKVFDNLEILNNYNKQFFRINTNSTFVLQELEKIGIKSYKSHYKDLWYVNHKVDLSVTDAFQRGHIIKSNLHHLFCYELLNQFIESKIKEEDGYLSILDPYIVNGELSLLFADRLNQLCHYLQFDNILKYQIIASDLNTTKTNKFNQYLSLTNLKKRNISINLELHNVENKDNTDLIEKFDLLILTPHNSKIGMNNYIFNQKYRVDSEEISKLRYQQKISFINNLKYLKKGGIILYVTQSFLFNENVFFNNKILELEEIEPVPIFKYASNKAKKLEFELFDDSSNCLTVLPTDLKAEGFFVALYQKK